MKGKVTKKRKIKEKDFKDALIKKALGYDATEIIEEYVSSEEGEIKLTKKKVTTKNVPPDITALKILMEGTEKDVASLTDEELEKEKIRLLELLNESNKKKEKKIEQ